MQKKTVVKKKLAGKKTVVQKKRLTRQGKKSNSEPIPTQVVQPEKPKLTTADLAAAMKSTGKKQVADILNDMVSSNGNLHMKGVISSPMAYTVMHIKANNFDRHQYPKCGRLFREIAETQEQFAVGHKGQRAKDVLKVAGSVLAQEYEIAKAQARNKLVGAK